MSKQAPKAKERRPLLAGLKPLDPAVETAFVRGDKASPLPPPQPPTVQAVPPAPAGEGAEAKPRAATKGRTPLTIRFRDDFAHALKRASLQRELDGATPHTLQDIVEEAVEPWLRTHGYLS